MGEEASANGDGRAGVLICDDNDSARMLLGLILERSTSLYVVGEAADGHEAVAEAERLQPDVITLDLAMPRCSGLDALPELRRVASDARIVVFSGFARANVAEHVLELGAASYLEKGAHPDVILATLEEALAGGPSAAPAGAVSSRGAEIRTRDL